MYSKVGISKPSIFPIHARYPRPDKNPCPLVNTLLEDIHLKTQLRNTHTPLRCEEITVVV